MKKHVFCAVLLVSALLAIPAMAEKIELTDMELAEISAQGWGPGVDIASSVYTESVSDLVRNSELFTTPFTQDQHGMELTIAPTTISIDSITTDTDFGTFTIGDLKMKVSAKVTVLY
ncbi:hypothetical protein [Desulfatibacillum aliphaticivorans]|uniref:hypothetical protein n=1 Tax=Desulfatibacillum aliphaticivorans TaxID=218208 RepID=UPI0003F7C921|nr:hypothetical protein [Desulfatibacillum aliphaticivorans]